MSKKHRDLFYNFSRARERESQARAELEAAYQEREKLANEIKHASHALADALLQNEQGQLTDGVIYWYGGSCILCLDGAIRLLPIVSVGTEELEKILADAEPPPAEEEDWKTKALTSQAEPAPKELEKDDIPF